MICYSRLINFLQLKRVSTFYMNHLAQGLTDHKQLIPSWVISALLPVEEKMCQHFSLFANGLCSVVVLTMSPNTHRDVSESVSGNMESRTPEVQKSRQSLTVRVIYTSKTYVRVHAQCRLCNEICSPKPVHPNWSQASVFMLLWPILWFSSTLYKLCMCTCK